MIANGMDGTGFEIEGFPPMAFTPDGCWVPLTRVPDAKGYLHAEIYGVRDRLHRHAYRIFKGRLGPNQIVRHACDNPSCCNPAHLLKGTHADNVRDRVERGRSASGERHGQAKLTDEQARAIYVDRETPAKDHAERHNVSVWTIYGVWHGQTYRDATADLRESPATASN